MSELALSLQGLHKRFGALHATNEVSLELLKGEIHALIGPNGAGKSTLIHLVSGALKPDKGRIQLLGKDISNAPVHQRVRAGLTRSFQITSIFNQLSVRQNLLLATQGAEARYFSFFEKRDASVHLNQCALALATRCGIAHDLLDHQAGNLPHGEQRKLEFALTLAAAPSVVLLDEPMAGMGPDESKKLAALVASLRGELTVLLVEHDMQAVFSLADRITVLVAGKVLASGTPEQIRKNPQVQQAYLGSELDDDHA
ncbi:ABC transporter ATP-binding protein [Paenalcaligenes niemegkensis]|uniref:ABC transporter ATP-binding protein n=1 Tax=Paenalcaligenes niemegkensis TaxID=2895469 RepID=UPI001EE9793E|nr:ABC transporter ATP-binding protein [Paenalcaligenes niemegkensis]MCQ9617225.1 ABC transporter ATP-binding protein [Paenalcaligenes niemegkensis]